MDGTVQLAQDLESAQQPIQSQPPSPVFNPGALEEKDNAKQEAALKAKQASLREHATQLTAQSERIEAEQRTMFLVLFGMLALLVIAVGLMGIVVTHKVAGPVFKMTRQLERLGDGSWEVPHPLRKGDELEDFFATFRTTPGSRATL